MSSMKTPWGLALVAVLVVGCSPGSAMDAKLIGEWRSVGSEPGHLSFSKATTNSEGFHHSFTEVRGGRTRTMYWKVTVQDDVAWLATRGIGYDPVGGRGVNASAKIVTLTSDRLVVEWGNVRSIVSGIKDRQEFERER